MITKSPIFCSAPWHAGVNYAGQSLDWMPTDTEQSFQRMMQEPQHRQYFEKQGWLKPNAIGYNLNSHGFRCEEFDVDEPCLIALGCSYTMGIGLPVECLWPTLIGKALGLKVYNLAWGGNSADTCYRLARYWIPMLKPQLVGMLAPPRSRIELLKDQENNAPAEVYMPSGQVESLIHSDMFIKYWWLNDENSVINNEKNSLAIKQLAMDNGARFVSLQADKEMSKSREEVGYARDYMHAGPRGHEMVAEKMLKELTWL